MKFQEILEVLQKTNLDKVNILSYDEKDDNFIIITGNFNELKEYLNKNEESLSISIIGDSLIFYKKEN